MSLKTGPQEYEFEAHTKVIIQAEEDFSLHKVDVETGEAIEILLRSRDGRLEFRTKDEGFQAIVAVKKGVHWSMDTYALASPYDKADPNPVELPEDALVPETLDQKLKRMLSAMVEERYGKDSEMYETFEESMDLDMDEDSEPLSGYEVTDMAEDFEPSFVETADSETAAESPGDTPVESAPEAEADKAPE
jgi:hypothetical protein